jgi:hypothetical protein
VTFLESWKLEVGSIFLNIEIRGLALSDYNCD